MNTRVTLLAGVVCAAACAMPGPMTEPFPAPPVPAVAGPAFPVPVPAAVPQDAGTDWGAVLAQARQDYSVRQQEAQLSAQQHYELALRHFESGDFERARVENDRALALDATHGPALALQRELAIYLGDAAVSPAERAVEDLINQERAHRQGVLVEIQAKYDSAVRAYNEGRFDEAETDLRTMLEYIKWLPVGPDLEVHRRNGVDLLERARQARQAAALAEEENRRHRVEEAVAAREAGQVAERTAQMQTLFDQAGQAFEREQYPEVIRICDRLLEDFDPRLQSVREMRNAAERLQYTQTDNELLRTYVEQWKRVFENLDIGSLMHEDVMVFPGRDIWDIVRHRTAHREREFEAAQSPEDQAIENRLSSQPITLTGTVTLDELIEHLRNITGKNVVFDERLRADGVDPAATEFPISTPDLPIRTVLNFYLRTVQPIPLTYEVRDGIIWIIAETELMRRTYLDIYDIKEITYALPDFPAPEITLTGGAAPPPPPADEGAPPFDIQQLQDLIQQVIEPDGWQNTDYGWSISAEEGTGLLVVRTVPTVHDAIRRLLNDLRATTGVLVNVEARFLTVEERFLSQIGMDFRDLDRVPVAFAAFARQPLGLLNPQDINNAFAIPQRFFDPDGAGPLSQTSAGIGGRWGTAVARTMGMRVQNLMLQDSLLSRFLNTVWGNAGGMNLQYILVDDVSVSALLRAVEKNGRGHTLNAPRLTLFNTQRGNMLVANQMAYIRDWNPSVAATTIVADPEVGVATDGISLDVRPIVSADRRFVTLEMRPTVAILSPPPPNIATIPTVIGGVDVTTNTPGRLVQIEVPNLLVQRLQTTVVLPDRGTVIIGGLGMYFDTDAESGIPMWKEIPLFNFLGGERFKGRMRSQLLIIVRAQIVIPSEEEASRFD